MSREGGRPRDSSVDEVVLASTLRLLEERGYAGLRINDVAETSRIAKTTIYRRWPTLTHLVVATMKRALGERSFHARGELEADFDGLIDAALGVIISGGPTLLSVALDIHAHGNEELRAEYRKNLIDPIRQQAIGLVRAARERGDLHEDTQPEAIVDAVIGGIIYRSAVLAEPLSQEGAKQFWRDTLRPHQASLQDANGIAPPR